MASAIRRHLSGHPEKGFMMQRHWLSLKQKNESVDCGKNKNFLIFSMEQGICLVMKLMLRQLCGFNKVNLEEAEEECVHGNRVDSEAGGGDDVGAHHDEQDWDEAGKRNRDMSSRMNKPTRDGMKMKEGEIRREIHVAKPTMGWE